MHAYIDESGDTGLTKKSTKNFLVTCIMVKDSFTLPRIARKVFTNNVKNKEKNNQLHAHQDTESTHKQILKLLNQVEYCVFVTNNKNYTQSLVEIFKRMECISMSKVYIARRDQRKKKSLEIFDLASKYKIPIFITEPKNEKGLQIADFVSWAIFRKIEFGDDLYFSKLRNVEFLAKIKP